MPAPQNLFADLPATLPEELFTTLLTTPGVKIERIVSRGHATAHGTWYDQETHEWVLVLQGRSMLQFENEDPIPLGPGDHLNIPAHCRHRVTWTDPDQTTVWLAVHYA